MFAFVDESGNTGQNLFDEAQPIFTTLALLTQKDFDQTKADAVAKLAASLGVAEIHAGEMGLDGVEAIAPALVSILKSAQARFAISRVEKLYLLATKVFDAIFDIGENHGAFAHIYRVRPLRLLTTFKLAALLPEDLARNFWTAMMAKKAQDATAGLEQFCDDVVALMPGVRDKRLAEIVGETMRWARDNPEAIYFHGDDKLGRQSHMPNTVGFGNLLDGIDAQSRAWGTAITLIRHDEQNEFRRALAFWHAYYANASSEAVEVTFGEKFVMQKGYGSRLQMTDSIASAGIQVADLVLWLFNRAQAKRPIGPKGWQLLRYALRRANQSDFSFEGVGSRLEREFGQMMATEPPGKAMEHAKGILDASEEIRAERMAEYGRQKALTAPESPE